VGASAHGAVRGVHPPSWPDGLPVGCDDEFPALQRRLTAVPPAAVSGFHFVPQAVRSTASAAPAGGRRSGPRRDPVRRSPTSLSRCQPARPPMRAFGCAFPPTQDHGADAVPQCGDLAREITRQRTSPQTSGSILRRAVLGLMDAVLWMLVHHVACPCRVLWMLVHASSWLREGCPVCWHADARPLAPGFVSAVPATASRPSGLLGGAPGEELHRPSGCSLVTSFVTAPGPPLSGLWEFAFCCRTLCLM
jgi:hypothetical protein